MCNKQERQVWKKLGAKLLDEEKLYVVKTGLKFTLLQLLL